MEENTFVDGLNLDSHNYQTNNQIMTDALNIRLITMDGNEYILQTMDGNSITGKTNSLLKPGYVPIGVKVYAGVAYIISALFDNSTFVSGEIGTYPSPDYTTATINANGNWEGNVVYEYKPLQNFKFDYTGGLEDLSVIGEFNTNKFNFNINHPVYDIELQNSYDGSINVIFTDFFNEPRLINTRIAFKGNRFEIINRRGFDSNIYNDESFNTTIKLQQQSRKIVNVEFATHGGGQLQAGAYSYYFYYETEEGFRTPIKFQSLPIYVYDGSTAASIKGLNRNNVTSQYLNTTKSNILALSNLDTQFPYLRCVYVYTSGQVGEINVTRLIENRYRFNEYFEFEHFGVENYQDLQLEELNLLDASITKCRTITQLNNRLFLGNIEQRDYPIESLEAFTKKIKIKQKIEQVKIELDLSEDFNTLYNPINFSKITDETHANSKCLYYRLGYWAEESYILGIIYIMSDGTESPVILFNSYDSLSTNTDLPKGLFRTKQRDVPLINRPTGINNNTTANHIYLEVDFNEAINDLGLPSDTLGFKIVRSKRNKNAITQGYVVNTVPIPLADNVTKDENNKSLIDYGNITAYRLTNNRSAKLIPVPGFQYEAPVAYGNAGDNNADFNDKWANTHSCMFNGNHYKGSRNGEGLDFDKRFFAFYSPDIIVKEEEYGKQFANADVRLRYLYQVNTVNSLRASTVVNEPSSNKRIPIMTCHKPIQYNYINGDILKAQADFCFGHLNQTNLLGFTSKAATLTTTSSNIVATSDFRDDFVELRASYNSYLGIKHETDKTLYNAINEREGNKTGDNDHDATVVCSETVTNPIFPNSPVIFSFQNRPYNNLVERRIIEVANIYNSGGLRPSNQLKSIYNVDTEAFFPITNTMYWNQAKADETKAKYIHDTATLNYDGQVDGLFYSNYDKTLKGKNNVLKVFGGDCFIGLCFRRIDINSIQRDDSTIPGNPCNTGITLCIATESNENPYLRNEELFDINEEGNRSFAPIYTNNQNYGLLWNQFLPDNAERLNDWHTWRRYRQPETDGYNRGYGTTETFKTYFYVLDVPFVKDKFSTRIYYSDLFVNGGFDNAYRYIQAANYKDYTSKLGAIVRIIGRDNGIVCVHENGVELIPVSQRTLINNDGTQAGQIFIDSVGILSDPSNTQVLSDFYGSNWQGSVCKTDNTVYGVDIERERIWRINNGLELISEFNIQTWINKTFNQYKGQIPIIAGRDVKTYYDTKTKDVWFVLFNQVITECSSCNTVFYQNLEQYINGVSTGIIVPNEESNPNYIPPFEGECPYPNQEAGLNICGINQVKVNDLCIDNDVLILDYKVNNPNVSNAIDNNITTINPANYGLTNQRHFYNGVQVILPQAKTNGFVQFLDVNDLNKCQIKSEWTNNQNRILLHREYTDEYAYAGYLQIDAINPNTYVDYVNKQFGIQFNWLWKNNFYAQDQYNNNNNKNLSDIVVTVTNPTGGVNVNNIQGTTINYFTKQHSFVYNYSTTGVYTINVKLYHKAIPIQIGETLPCPCWTYDEITGDCICPEPILPILDNQDLLVGEYTFYITIPSNVNNEEWLGRDAICIDIGVKAESIIYNERLNKWITFTSCEPIEMFSLYDRLHSFNLQSSQQIWEHHANNFSNFYGNQYKSYFEYNVGANSIGIAKMFDNIEIIGNDIVPEQIVMNNDNEINLTQNIVPRKTNSIIKANHDYRESYHYITIGKNVIKEPVSYKRVRDKYCKFKVIYAGDKKFIIRGIKTIIRQSYA